MSDRSLATPGHTYRPQRYCHEIFSNIVLAHELQSQFLNRKTLGESADSCRLKLWHWHRKGWMDTPAYLRAQSHFQSLLSRCPCVAAFLPQKAQPTFTSGHPVVFNTQEVRYYVTSPRSACPTSVTAPVLCSLENSIFPQKHTSPFVSLDVCLYSMSH